jgi:hypothetical protein
MLLNRRAGLRYDRFYGLGALMFIMWGVQRRFAVPPLARDVIVTSLVPFVLAYLVLFKLYLPGRYVLYPFMFAALVLIAANVEGTRIAVQQRLMSRPVLRWLALGLLLLGYTYAQHRYFVLQEIQVGRADMQLYQYIRSLPKDVVIAGHPLDLNNVPLLTQRQVLVNEELAEAYYTGYYPQVRQRLFDTFAAYYASDRGEIHRFVQRYGVDYILVNKHHFDPAFLQGQIYYEPFDSFLRQRLLPHQRFALLDMPADQHVYADGRYILVSVKAFK